MTLDVVTFKGIASGHLVAISMQVNKNRNPPLAFGNGPTRSIATLSKGVVTTSLICIGLLGGLALSAL